MKILITFLLISLIAQSAFAYTKSRAESGQSLFWKMRNNDFNIYIDTNFNGRNSMGLTENLIKSIVTNSLNQYNNQNILKINPIFTEELPALGSSRTIRFSSNPGYFGSGVLAVTSLNYSSSSGQIVSGDILINESIRNTVTFTGNKNISGGNTAYLGDILSHELGHFVGLSHTETVGATMLYSVFRGQHKISQDDIQGYHNIYGSRPNKGIIKGKIVGKNQVPVFGSHVQLIDYETGYTDSSQITEADGSFYFTNLDPEKLYIIFHSPIKNSESLPSFYKTAQSNYCEGNPYKPSFFSKCGGRQKGRAQLIRPSSYNETDVGNITIQCTSALQGDYLYKKLQDPHQQFEFLSDYDPHYVGDTLTGIFFKNELGLGVAGQGDQYLLDLTHVDSSAGNIYLDLKVLTNVIGSDNDVKVTVAPHGSLTGTDYYNQIDPHTGVKKPRVEVKHLLSVNPSDNKFTVIIKPIELSNFEKIEIFASPSLMTNKENIYLATVGLAQNIAGQFKVYSTKNTLAFEDNNACLEGDVVQSVEPFREAASIANNQKLKQQSVTCGTINTGQNGGSSGGGPLSFAVGLILALFLLNIRTSKDIFLSK